MNDKNTRKRSPWSMFIPYLLIGLVIIFIVYWAISSFGNQTTTWQLGRVDAYLGYETTLRQENNQTVVDEKITATEDSYYIPGYAESTSYTTTTISGSAYRFNRADPAHPISTSFNFVITISNAQWQNPFEAFVYGEDGTPIKYEHASYSSLFKAKQEEWNNDPWITKNIGIAGGGQVQDAFAVSWWDTWGPTIIYIVLIVGIGFFLISMLNRSVSGSNRQAMDFNKSPARREDASKIRFTDVAGCDEEKAEMEELVEYLKEPKKYSQYGARLPKGVLLIGPPGTGKTLLAKAVAGEAGVPFYSISGSDFVEMFVGVGAGRVRDLFKKAKQTAPCIIFIDEIDAVGRQRGAGLGGGNDEREQTLNQLLVEMDGFDYNAGILVIAATNRDDVLDPALLRPGRFDRIITVSLPDKVGREAIFKVHARNKKIDPKVDFKSLATRTVGFSGADIENILNEAAILAVRFHKDCVGMAEIDEAIDRRIAGPAKSGRGMNEKERRQVAYHESGHAVIGLYLPHSEKVQKITIIPRGQTGGHVLMTPEDDRFLLTRNELLAEITGLLGGRSSEELFFDDISTGAENDIQRATQIARSMVTNYGMSELGPIQYERSNTSVFLGRDYTDTTKNFSTQVAYEIDKAVREIVETAHQKALALLREHKAEVDLIANTLLEKETITAEEIDALIKTGKLPGANGPTLDKEEEKAEQEAIAEVKKEETAETKAPEEPKKEDEVKKD